MEKIEEILVNDPLYSWHIISKRWPKYNFSGEINPALLGRDSHVDYVISWIKNYIGFPLIEDDFESHSLRREWKRELTDKYGKEAKKFIQENKLRINMSLQGLWSASSFICNSFLVDEIPILNDKTREIIKITEEGKEDYNAMNIRERIVFVRGMEDKAYGILQELRAN
ncbi:Uncharacterised protein [uncultured archaeon]|nr:Uncharacterised protein [uncultured archaeon]